MKIAVTGGTGFVGARLLDAAKNEGHEVRALTRRPMPPRPGIEWQTGALDQPAALAALTLAVDAVIHVAGVISGTSAADFDVPNVEGTRAVLDAAVAGGAGKFVHVSSLAAREPQLSLYGASKAKSEALVHATHLPWAIVRPPAVYGPGDKETLELFKMAKSGIVLLPPPGRLSLIHVDDLVALLLKLAGAGAPSGTTIEPAGDPPGGLSHEEFADLLAASLGRRTRSISMPAAIMRAGAKADRLFRGKKAKLTADRAAYFSHPDWVVDPAKAAPADLWVPKIAPPGGLAATAAWYRAQGWL